MNKYKRRGPCPDCDGDFFEEEKTEYLPENGSIVVVKNLLLCRCSGCGNTKITDKQGARNAALIINALKKHRKGGINGLLSNFGGKSQRDA